MGTRQPCNMAPAVPLFRGASMHLVAMLLFIALTPIIDASIPACTRNRPSNGKHRVVSVTSQTAASRPSNDTAATELCCAYTWLQIDNAATSNRMVTYDGSVRTYSASDWNTLTAQLISDICGMSMGSDDCRSCSLGNTASAANAPRVWSLVVLGAGVATMMMF